MMQRGVICLLLAEFCFASATVFAKFITRDSDIPAIEITFFRFFIGFFLFVYYIRIKKVSLRPNRWFLVILRAAFSFTALVFFFYSVQYTSVTNANMLNMTYPVFVFMIAPFFWKQKIKTLAVFYLLLTITGIYLVIQPDFSSINPGDIYGLLSGIVAAFSIIVLSMAREHDSTVIIVFYLMTLGIVFNGFLMLPVFVMPKGIQYLYLVASGVFGVLGQVFLTMAYKYINAKDGSMVSSSRIVFAAFLGFFIFSDALTLPVIAGGLMIVGSIIGVSRLQYR
ncbi:MAG: DMT family transporter [Bacteroidales bacterium]|nr:DMT family transporter [Bacteroidales bacterium]